jgi:hypothetical protein
LAEDLNKIIDAVEQELQETRQTDDPEDRPSSRENRIMTNPERFPFPNTEDEPDPACH